MTHSSAILLVGWLVLLPASHAQSPRYTGLCDSSGQSYRITPERAELIADLRRLFADSSHFPDIPSAEGKIVDCPRVLNRLMPPYPSALRKKNQEGRLVLAVIVDDRGTVLDARIAYSSNAAFNDVTLRSARGTTFTPARVDGAPAPFVYMMSFEWKLR